jgi:hypothetical protein
MAGETDLQNLLANMKPLVHEGEFVFCTVSPKSFAHLRVEPIGWFQEPEGITIIIDRDMADRERMKYESAFRMISLTVHSSVEAVGFLAAITRKLASAGVGVNPASAYYHDHLFVPSDKTEMAMRLLNEMMHNSV